MVGLWSFHAACWQDELQYHVTSHLLHLRSLLPSDLGAEQCEHRGVWLAVRAFWSERAAFNVFMASLIVRGRAYGERGVGEDVWRGCRRSGEGDPAGSASVSVRSGGVCLSLV